ncbi:hypothetical protein C8R44DRAFT_894871 [Mycena epipterygia]|nr:hypothetical protein C8R44DRAFT_894871 [Mycena epipterygia]
MPNFPPEVWMRIFTFVKDNDTFKEIVLTSRQFNALGKEERTRNKYWKNAEDVEPRLLQWATKPRRRLVKDLNIRLKDYDHNFVAQRNIFASLHIFQNLSSLTIRNGSITSHIHTSLTHLPSLRRLKLQWCAIYTMDRAAAAPATPYTVTNLLLHEVRIIEPGGDRVDLDIEALRTRNLTVMPLPLLHGLQSLSISSDKSAARVLRQAHALLPDTPHIVHLSVVGPPSAYTPEATVAVAPVLTTLTTFCGPRCIAVWVLPPAVSITEIILTDEIAAPDALRVVVAVHPGALCSVEMTLKHWNAEVLYEIAHRFAKCKRIKIIYRYWGPSDDFLFDFGVHHLPRMPLLDTLLIHARPQDAVEKAPSYQYYPNYEFTDCFEDVKKWEEEGARGERDVPPPLSEHAIKKYFAIWTRYNAQLEVVSLGERLWTRAFRGTVWDINQKAV